MVDFAKILKNANKNWKKAKTRAAESPSFQEYDDGKYTARLVSAKLGVADSGRNQIAFGWKFEEGDYEGKVKTAYQGIDSEDNLYFLARDLERLGYELPDDLSDLPGILKDIEKSKILASITLKTKSGSDFQNVYIRKVFGDDDDEEADESEEEETDDAEESDDAEEESDDAEDESDDEEEEGDDSEEEGDEEEESDDAEEEGDEEGDEAEEGEDEAEDADEIELEVNMRVVAETAKGREPGKIIELLEDEEKVRVKLDNGKTVRVGLDAIEVEPEKPAKKEKKPAPAPAKKPAAAPAKKPAKKPAPPAKKKGKK